VPTSYACSPTRGDSVVVVDDLSSGQRERIADVPLVEIDLSTEASPKALADVMREHEVGAVIHIAAKKQVGESAQRPAYYYKQNVGGSAKPAGGHAERGSRPDDVLVLGGYLRPARRRTGHSDR
jgi:UDP-glucose 4-epimerase